MTIAADQTGPRTGIVKEDDLDQRGSFPRYVLITPARNEAAFIENTLESMARQTVLPVKWVIVDDGPTDSTPQIVTRYIQENHRIEMVQIPRNRDRRLSCKVHTL